VKKHQGRIFIDAEQSYFQTAIHKLALELQEQYNRDRIIVYNTYQCYRKVNKFNIKFSFSIFVLDYTRFNTRRFSPIKNSSFSYWI